MNSIIHPTRDRCYLCGRYGTDIDPLDEHHVYFGSNRKNSEEYGLKVYLHHNTCHIFGENAVHANHKVCRDLQAEVQRIAMEQNGWTVEEFIAIFGRNYIE